MPKPKLTTQQFIKKAHPQQYDYSITDYKGKGIKIKFICPIHGEVEQDPYQHLKRGCQFCCGKGRKITNTESFIREAQKIHGNKYDYGKTKYEKAHKCVTIICLVHGPFSQRPDAHIHQKQGCPKCGLDNRTIPHKKTTKQFITEAKKKWNYDYSLTEYINKYTNIKFTCNKHGVIEQKPFLHLKSGCPYCNGRGISRHSQVSFTKIAEKIHKNKYNYSKTKFVRMTDIITITCPEHGDFDQRAGNHIHLKNGCPECAKQLSTSRGEKEVLQFIRDNYSGEVLENDREVLDGKEIDIYLPELKIGIEYHGVYWHLETVRGRKYHYKKWKLAHNAGIRLIQMYDVEWKEKRTILESKILNFLGLNKRLGARKCQIVQIDRNTKNQFLTENHLQGSDASKIWYCLEYDGEIVSCMTFGPSRFNHNFDYELLRFVNKCNLSVIGAASKLLRAFRRDYNGSIISYADKRYSEGDLYENLGFQLNGETQPSFSYFNIGNGILYNRMKFQKKKIKNFTHYSNSLTEYEIMQLNGYDRIWDAGQYRFIIKPNQTTKTEQKKELDRQR